MEETRLKTTTPGHRRRLSDSADSNYERSPRIVEMDTCHRRSRSSRIAIRHSRDHSSDCLTPAPMPPAPLSCSSPISIKQPPRLSIQRSQHHERDTRHAKTAHNTPRLGAPPYGSSPANKSVDGMARRGSRTGTRSAARATWPARPRQRRGRGARARPGSDRPPRRRRGRGDRARGRHRTAASASSAPRTPAPATPRSSATRRPEITTWTECGDQMQDCFALDVMLLVLKI